ncbi:ras-related RABA6a-like [Olea europaea subsp. europaea]|uniref:Ras-related RABA6a-like n=1 Tax=Olea europaea subsp. europaea TaxID=158383 RepID=A0A8S0PSN8_OLEEU|nr:ras-related RABA6a-like [Olea europaea subsp. europaea]
MAIRRKEFGGSDTMIILVGDKSDLSNSRKVNVEDGQSSAQLEEIVFIEISAKENLNVEEAFHQMAGRIHEINSKKRLKR